MPPTAADQLVEWLRTKFGDHPEFRQHLVYRMTGQTPRLVLDAADSRELQLVPADEQLRKAMDFDDSLFATEEQNLFIDEIKEAVRWRSAFESIDAGDGDAVSRALREWTEAGLRCLIGLAEKEDGPLGWTSDQHVFAGCARVLLCAVAVSKGGKSLVVEELLERFRGVGERVRVHGSLLAMAV